MADINKFLSLSQLSDEALGEVVREGEVRLQAQLAAANSADQRALAWTGFLVTITLAVIGAALSLYLTKSHLPVARVAFCFGLITGVASFLAMRAARPVAFCFPGNDPENWLPENWHSLSGKNFDLRRARIEQAACLSSMIKSNAEWADSMGWYLTLAMDLAYVGAGLSGLALVVTVF